MNTVDFLSIGHCCHDKTENGLILGGSVSYSSIIAAELGREVSLISSVGDDFLFHNVFKNKSIQFYNVPAKETTVFENVYNNNSRIQYIHSRANTITKYDIPPSLLDVPVVLIGSISREIDFDLVSCFTKSLKGAIIQGEMRTWDESGLISSAPMDWELLRDLDLVFISDDDMMGMEDFLPNIISRVNQVILTHAENGATIYKDGKEYFFPSYKVNPIDSTGAGDAYSTAYLIKYAETKNVQISAVFAHCAASIIIEDVGLENVEALMNIEERVEDYLKRFPNKEE
ncbi:MAG: PfkB family carbohydrate kinase [Saprospiraceae bacterium]